MKNSLVLYYDYADCLTDLNDHDFRCVIMSIIEYDQSGTDPSELSAAAKIAFNFIKKDLDRNRDKWEDIKEKRSQAGKKGGQAKASKTSKCKQKLANQAVNVNVNGNVDVKDKDKDIKDSCAELEISAPSDTPIAIVFPTNVTDEEYSITTEQVKEFEALYPAVDVEQELRNMRGWLINNPKRRKTASGVLRFVNGWLAKEQNKAGKAETPTRAAPKTFAQMEWEEQAKATERVIEIARARREQSNGTDGSNNNIIKIDCL